MAEEMAPAEMGIKNIMEVLEGIKPLAIVGKKIAADGKVGIDDLSHLMPLVAEVGKLTAAVQDIEQVWPEMKDVSVEEAQMIAAKVFEIIKAVKAA